MFADSFHNKKYIRYCQIILWLLRLYNVKFSLAYLTILLLWATKLSEFLNVWKSYKDIFSDSDIVGFDLLKSCMSVCMCVCYVYTCIDFRRGYLVFSSLTFCFKPVFSCIKSTSFLTRMVTCLQPQQNQSYLWIKEHTHLVHYLVDALILLFQDFIYSFS